MSISGSTDRRRPTFLLWVVIWCGFAPCLSTLYDVPSHVDRVICAKLQVVLPDWTGLTVGQLEVLGEPGGKIHTYHGLRVRCQSVTGTVCARA